jgi:hypothetical protein
MVLVKVSMDMGQHANGRFFVSRGQDFSQKPVTLSYGSVIGRRPEFGLSKKNARYISRSALKVTKVYKDSIVVKVVDGSRNLPPGRMHRRLHDRHLNRPETLDRKKYHKLRRTDHILFQATDDDFVAFAVADAVATHSKVLVKEEPDEL